MKLGARDAQSFLEKPDTRKVGALIYGEDPGQVLDARRRLVSAIMAGDSDPLRLDQFDARALQNDAAALDTALRTRGFFPGRRIVLVSGGGDGLSGSVQAVLPDLTPDDAFLVVTAGILAGRSSLRKLFEAEPSVVALPIYPAVLDIPEIERRLEMAGLACGLGEDARSTLAQLAQDMDHGAFLQFLDVIAISGLDRTAPLSDEDINKLSPLSLDAATDRLIDAVVGGRTAEVGPLLRRLTASGSNAVGLTLAVTRHFRQLLSASLSDGGPAKALAWIRPPSRKDAMLRQLDNWSAARLEQANRMLFDTDRRLRSPGQRPDLAMVERVFLRLAMMAGRR